MNVGIYMIKNKNNGKFYIGSSINMAARWAGHRSDLKKGKHHSKHLQRSWDKYGEESFEFTVIESVENTDDLLVREQHYLDTLKPFLRENGYNSVRNAANCLGFRHTEETKRKMSEARSGTTRSEETKKKISEALKGRVVSEAAKRKMSQAWEGRQISQETREKMSQAHKGQTPWNKGVPHSEETKRKISSANKGKPSHRRGKKLPQETRQKMSASRKGEKNPNSIMTWSKVRDIRREYKEGGVTQKQLSEKYQCSKSCIKHILKNRVWREE